jgi:hypothetical protein
MTQYLVGIGDFVHPEPRPGGWNGPRTPEYAEQARQADNRAAALTMIRALQEQQAKLDADRPERRLGRRFRRAITRLVGVGV